MKLSREMKRDSVTACDGLLASAREEEIHTYEAKSSLWKKLVQIPAERNGESRRRNFVKWGMVEQGENRR
jgi:hypothetical protein